MKTRTIFWIFILALLSGAARAQDVGDVPVGASDPLADEMPAPSEPAEQPQEPTPLFESDDFTPTEEISEDISVPFPVDI